MRAYALIAAFPLAACSVASDDGGVAASGSGTSRTYPVTGFTGVALRGSDNVDVRAGTAFSVHAEGPAKELDKLRIVRTGDTLDVGRQNNTGFSFSSGHDRVTVYVTMPRIAAGTTAGSGNLRIDRADGQSFTGSVTGSGDLDIAALTARRAEFSVAGSGNVSAKGDVGALGIELAGSGNVQAGGLKAASADVSVAGSGNVTAAVAGPAQVSIIGSGDVDLGPAAKCTTSKLGSGSVKCG